MMGKKIRLLFLAPRLPFPMDTGGKIRTANLIKQIAKTCELHLACFSFQKEDYRLADEFSRGQFSVTLIELQKPAGSINKAWKIISDDEPYSISKYNNPAMKKTISDMVSGRKFDLVHVDHIHMAHYRCVFPDIPALVDEHNVEYRILERCVPVEKNWIMKNVYRQQAAKTKRFEKEFLDKFTACSAVSDDDARDLMALTNKAISVHVVPNGVDTEFFQLAEQGGCPLQEAIVFTGSLDWLPNEDAVLFFCQDILPLIHRQRPHVKFFVVGKNASDAILKEAKKNNQVVVTGRVDDVRPFLERSKVFVAPLRIGGGTRLKILEAMSMKRAVVSTTVGAEGISYREGQHVLLADRPNDFAARVLALLSDPLKCQAMGEAGRQLVLNEYDWNIVRKKLLEIYERMLAK